MFCCECDVSDADEFIAEDALFEKTRARNCLKRGFGRPRVIKVFAAGPCRDRTFTLFQDRESATRAYCQRNGRLLLGDPIRLVGWLAYIETD